MGSETAGILWAVMALVLIAPAAYRMVRNNPRSALESVALWLGVILILGYAYQHLGIAEWWENKRGGGFEATPIDIGPKETGPDANR